MTRSPRFCQLRLNHLHEGTHSPSPLLEAHGCEGDELASLPLEETLETLRTGWGAIAGSPEIAIEQLRAYEQAGVEELILEWFPADDVEGAEAFATDVLSRL